MTDKTIWTFSPEDVNSPGVMETNNPGIKMDIPHEDYIFPKDNRRTHYFKDRSQSFTVNGSWSMETSEIITLQVDKGSKIEIGGKSTLVDGMDVCGLIQNLLLLNDKCMTRIATLELQADEMVHALGYFQLQSNAPTCPNCNEFSIHDKCHKLLECHDDRSVPETF
jgi:hypothetical protein